MAKRLSGCGRRVSLLTAVILKLLCWPRLFAEHGVLSLQLHTVLLYGGARALVLLLLFTPSTGRQGNGRA